VGVIRLRQRGLCLAETAEDVKVVDWNGNEYEVTRRPIALCRCAESAKKPSCDATHVKSASRLPRPPFRSVTKPVG
jgi:CDGSH-type Zn-finger protein